MRLLHHNNDNDFSLTEFFEGEIPEYAILSHRWGLEEVALSDMIDGTSKSKAGYEKIKFCGERVKHDGLQYFWVDTCCIDQSNAVEVQEAINSMFRWYQNAVKCYVYLSDVSTKKRKSSDSSSERTWQPAFRLSEWFTRGWTLQELLAPRPDSVEFFSREGDYLGNRTTLQQQIHEITKIPLSALEGTDLSKFEVEDRLLWVESRRTLRKEDKAYSMLGICGVYMPLIYGEGEKNAFRRLRKELGLENDLLHALPYAVEAPFNSVHRQDEPTCLPNTRVDLLQDLCKWADREDQQCTFWLNGLAGTGKSTIARTIARRYHKKKRLAASFFFSKGSGDVSHASKLFTSIARQLADNIPLIRHHICDAISNCKDIASQSYRDQWSQLILYPLSKLHSSSSVPPYILVIDALDECDKDEHIRIILQILSEASTLKTARLRVFLTSRPEIPIRHGFLQIPDTDHLDFILHNISPSIIDHDINVFVRYNLNAIAKDCFLTAGWPGEQIIDRLVCNAGGLFIWAATACRFIREGKRFAAKRLDMILGSSSITANAPEKYLNDIYLTVLRNSISLDYTADEVTELCNMLKKFLGSIVTLFSPLSTQALGRLLDTSAQEVDQILDDLHAILDIPKDRTCPLRLHHPSLRDFLLNEERCSDSNFQVDEKQAHQVLADHCIQLMSISLQRDVCMQRAPGRTVAEVESCQINECLPPEVQYACLYWVQHLQKSNSRPLDGGQVHEFIRAHLLHWLEALGWMGKTSDGLLAIYSLEALIPADKSPNLHAFVHDAKRFVLSNRSAIEQAPLQLYCSTLLFAPEMSIIRREFQECIPAWVRPQIMVQANWSAALQTLEGHSNWVQSVAFSPDGMQAASGSDDMTVRLWGTPTGAVLKVLEGHAGGVKSVAFSPDGTQLVSGSTDRTLRLWDAATGVALKTLEGHSDSVLSVAFSPDNKKIVSGSADETVRLWDAVTGVVIQTLEGHSNWVRSVAFSPDGAQVISGSHDETVRLWDITAGTALRKLEGHYDRVHSVAFSPDGTRIVSGSADRTLRLWDTATGVVLHTLEGHSGMVNAVAFSPDGMRVVSGSRDWTVQLWDTTVGAALQTLEGHSDIVSAVAFSPDGTQVVSGSGDCTVWLWDSAAVAKSQMLKGHSGRVSSVAFSPDGTKIVSGSADGIVRLWDTETGAMLLSIEGHSELIPSVAFSPDGMQVVSGSGDWTLRVWDAATGTGLQTLKSHSGSVHSVAFSPDGRQVVSGSRDMTARIWDISTGATLQTLEGHSGLVRSVAYSPDGKRVVSGSGDWTARLWDVATGAALRTLEGHLGVVWSISFSPDGTKVVSGSADRTVRLWNAATGAVLQTLEISASMVSSVVFLPDGTLVPNIFASYEWIQLGHEKILWLPANYRSTCKDVVDKTIVLGHSSGKLSIFMFKPGPKLIGSV